MPTKMSRGGNLKTHNRSASATTHNPGKHAITGTGGAIGYPQVIANTDITRTKSGEKIRRTGSDVRSFYLAQYFFRYLMVPLASTPTTCQERISVRCISTTPCSSTPA